MARQVLPVIWTAGDIDALKATLKARAGGTDQTVQTCAALDDATRASWGQFYAALSAWAGEPTSFWTTGSMANRAEAYEDELYQWQLKVQSAGCALTVPAFNPQPPEPPGASMVKWLAVGVVAVAGAYCVSKVAGAIPQIKASFTKSPPNRREQQIAAGKRLRARKKAA